MKKPERNLVKLWKKKHELRVASYEFRCKTYEFRFTTSNFEPQLHEL